MPNKIMISTYNLLINHHIWMSELESCWCFAANHEHFAHHVWIKSSQYIRGKPCKNTCLNETCPVWLVWERKHLCQIIKPQRTHQPAFSSTQESQSLCWRKYGRGRLGGWEVNGRKKFNSSVITTLIFILSILCMTVTFKIHKIRENTGPAKFSKLKVNLPVPKNKNPLPFKSVPTLYLLAIPLCKCEEGRL